MQAIPTFTAGEAPRAADFAALVAAARELMSGGGLFQTRRRAGMQRHYFTPGGTSVPVMDKDGEAKATAAEMLWQVGEQVAVVTGGGVTDMAEAQLAGIGKGVSTGVHADIRYAYGPPPHFVPVPESVEYAAAAWEEETISENEDGSVEMTGVHGEHLLGAVVRGTAYWPPNVTQYRHKMWAMPQMAMMIWRDVYYPATEEEAALYGQPCVLPGDGATQVLGSKAVSGSAPGTASESVQWYALQWLGKLDAFGQLHMAARAKPLGAWIYVGIE